MNWWQWAITGVAVYIVAIVLVLVLMRAAAQGDKMHDEERKRRYRQNGTR